jgi:ABC-type sugar transport system ATPase subunit
MPKRAIYRYLCTLQNICAFMSWLQVSNVSKTQQAQAVLNNINFALVKGQNIAIAGETGSGKTTLLKVIASLEQADTGAVYFENEKVLGPNYQLIPGHKDIAYLSQHFELRNNYFVHEVLTYANKLEQADADKIYEICRITKFLKRRTNQLSGGEKQRVALARLLTTNPKLLLLDEPFSNLDAVHKNIMKFVLYDISEKLGITCIIVSHDALDTLAWAHKILVLQQGHLIQNATPYDIYNKPINEYCAALFGTYNILTAAQINAYSTILPVPHTTKKILIRPEQCFITNDHSKALEGNVKQIKFMGAYSILYVHVVDKILRISLSAAAKIKVGDTILVTINSEALMVV